MAVLMAVDPMPMRAERRRFQRVKVTLYGRYMLQDRSEHQCRVTDMSPGDAAFQAERAGSPGERVVAYLDHIGRIEGQISRVLDGGFAMTINASERKRDKLAAQLTWIVNRHELDLPQERRHERIIPRNPISTIHLPAGGHYPCRIVDLSVSGAALETEVKPPVGSQIFLASLRCEVVRHFDDGIAIEFTVPQEQSLLLSEFLD
ncbi:PilZ domain-containing protein [Chelativorans sp. Marseille-P2723]|uniref:PilZ domain-containing protein n=1 Tax=Chelativorans sp. Marseille-P2723 TaxID=2709133 RepID=UPI001570D0A3|nr:PilZ domain-containing protein [Chelativorans sp. Marseille-P2723]